MPDQIAIRVLVNDSDVGPKLRGVVDHIKRIDQTFAGSKFLSGKELGNIQNRFRNLTIPGIKIPPNLAPELERSGEGARKLIEGFHGLSPILEGVGLGL